MSQNRTLEEKVGDWAQAYEQIRHMITPPEFRPLMALMGQKDGEAGEINVQAVNIGVAVSRIVMANDRAAAFTAALLTANGVKPLPMDLGELPE